MKRSSWICLLVALVAVVTSAYLSHWAWEMTSFQGPYSFAYSVNDRDSLVLGAVALALTGVIAAVGIFNLPAMKQVAGMFLQIGGVLGVLAVLCGAGLSGSLDCGGGMGYSGDEVTACREESFAAQSAFVAQHVIELAIAIAMFAIGGRLLFTKQGTQSSKEEAAR